MNRHESDITYEPGPSELMPYVREYMAQGVELSRFSHRSPEFTEVVENTKVALRRLLSIPESNHVFFLGSATNAMSLTPRNCAAERTFHFVNGAFTERFKKEAVSARKSTEVAEKAWGHGFDLADPAYIVRVGDAELLCVTHNETSTGVALNPVDIAQLKKLYPDALLAVDITSSVPYVDLDFTQADVSLFSVQKGFGMPAGLGILVASPEAVERSKELERLGFDTGGYQSFGALAKAAAKHQTPETPNMADIYVLGKVCGDLIAVGGDRLRAEIDTKARFAYEYFENRPGFTPFVQESRFRSPTVIVIDVEGGSSKLIALLRERHNIRVGDGYGSNYKGRQIRIGNFPAHTEPGFQDLASAVDEVCALEDYAR
jgi:phosphoserine aminotransferase